LRIRAAEAATEYNQVKIKNHGSHGVIRDVTGVKIPYLFVYATKTNDNYQKRGKIPTTPRLPQD
jgi:hypothetical protein